MLARTSFKQKRHAPFAKEPRVTKWPVALSVRANAAMNPIAGEVVSQPKPVAQRNPHLLAMARGMPCLIRSPICNFNPETTVACHGGGVANGKGMGCKVSDALTCWGCSACNHYTDAYGGATKAQKQMAFMVGHLAQVCEWRAIAGSTAANSPDRAAAKWALERLNATPVFMGEK